MHARINNPKHKNYESYKKLGITICEEWKSFDKFIKDMGIKPSIKHTIERVENNKGYFKDNCKWATNKDQQRNRRDTAFATYKGIKKSISEWSEILGIRHKVLYKRIVVLKWTPKRAFHKTTKTGIKPNRVKI
ncbi:MAG: hypothetical protein V4666_08340 [Bacteroidota bacterium]